MEITYNRKQMKKRSKGRLKKNYFIFVIVCLIASFLGIANVDNLELITMTMPNETTRTQEIDRIGGNMFETLDNIIDKKGDVPPDFVQKALKGVKDFKLGPIEVGRSKGVFAKIINSFTSGEVFLNGYVLIRNLTNSDSAALIVMISLSALLILGFVIFILSALEIIFARIFMEGRTYDKVPMNRVFFLVRMKKWFNASKNMFFVSLLQFLWSLTIIGGIIKRYSYFMAPYIIAERPDLTARESVTLSRKMMKGHKWQCFVFDLSFLGWDLLEILTLGLSGIFFSSPYCQAARAEYAEYVRREAKIKMIPNADKLTDTYLYEKASPEFLKETYQDIEDIMKTQSKTKMKKETGVKGFFANTFGLVWKYNDQENEFTEYQERQATIDNFEDIIQGLVYPARLAPIAEVPRISKNTSLHYMRRYSVLSVIMLFFVCSMIGWLWEVALHLFEDGEFVNRGVSHGPWLPIYGSGAILILLVLYKFRAKPVLEFITAIVLCGIVEYITSYVLEVTHNGTKWWDYTGYFLNINGRICAEGLLVFGLAGLIVVYLLAPVFDNFIRKISTKVLIPIALVLICVFTADQIYSSYYPNTGKGITDYGNANNSSMLLDGQLLAVHSNNQNNVGSK